MNGARFGPFRMLPVRPRASGRASRPSIGTFVLLNLLVERGHAIGDLPAAAQKVAPAAARAHRGGVNGFENETRRNCPEVGRTAGGAPEVQLISFTGSDRAGGWVAGIAARRSKGALESAVPAGSPAATPTAARCAPRCHGRSCRAKSWRRSRLAVHAAGSYRAGDPADERTTLGPVVSAAQREHAYRMITSGVQSPAPVAASRDAAVTAVGQG
jgi:hypothetical protein